MTKAKAHHTSESKADISRQRFICDYLSALKERTRSEKQGGAYGLDWVVYNLGLAMGWTPVRLPFMRTSGLDTAKTKTEPEFGIDLSFLADKGTTLQILVLKDEPLTYKNWTANNFESDLRRASGINLSSDGLANVKMVNIILAYNKDDDAAGIKSFDDLVGGFPPQLKGDIVLTTERWNLSQFSERVQAHLLTPELLPQNLSGLLSYMCSQVADFQYGTEAWDRQLVPNWRRFLAELDKGRDKKTAFLLIPVALVILKQSMRETPDAVIGWLDLVEWAMLWIWEAYPRLDKPLHQTVINIWLEFFLANYETFLVENAPVLNVEHGVQAHKLGRLLDAVNDSCAIFWLIERIGIFVMGSCEVLRKDVKLEQELRTRIVCDARKWIADAVRLQPALLRPVIDLHHIGVFLIWFVTRMAQDTDSIQKYFQGLANNLFLRRIGMKNMGIPFVEGGNHLELVGEAIATGKMPPEFIDSTSYLVLMMMELCCSLDDASRDDLLEQIQHDVIEGRYSDGAIADGVRRLLLQDWVPLPDWTSRVLKEHIQDGIAIINPYEDALTEEENKSRAEKIRAYVEIARGKFSTPPYEGISRAALILACVKNKSPLPSFIWRDMIFPKNSA